MALIACVPHGGVISLGINLMRCGFRYNNFYTTCTTFARTSVVAGQGETLRRSKKIA